MCAVQERLRYFESEIDTVKLKFVHGQNQNMFNNNNRHIIDFFSFQVIFSPQ